MRECRDCLEIAKCNKQVINNFGNTKKFPIKAIYISLYSIKDKKPWFHKVRPFKSSEARVLYVVLV